MAEILPARAQRVTVLGFTRNMAATSDGVSSCARAGKITNALTQNQLAIVMNARLNEVAIELADHACRALMEALEVFFSPPIVQATLRVILRALIVKAFFIEFSLMPLASGSPGRYDGRRRDANAIRGR